MYVVRSSVVESDFSFVDSSALELFKADIDAILDTLTTLVRKHIFNIKYFLH